MYPFETLKTEGPCSITSPINRLHHELKHSAGPRQRKLFAQNIVPFCIMHPTLQIVQFLCRQQSGKIAGEYFCQENSEIIGIGRNRIFYPHNYLFL